MASGSIQFKNAWLVFLKNILNQCLNYNVFYKFYVIIQSDGIFGQKKLEVGCRLTMQLTILKLFGQLLIKIQKHRFLYWRNKQICLMTHSNSFKKKTYIVMHSSCNVFMSELFKMSVYQWRQNIQDGSTYTVKKTKLLKNRLFIQTRTYQRMVP